MGAHLEASDFRVKHSRSSLPDEEHSPRVDALDLTASPEEVFAKFAGSPGLAFLDTSAPAGQTGSEGWSVLTAFPVESCLEELPRVVIGAGSPSGDIPFTTGWIGFASYESSSRWNPDLAHRAPANVAQTWWGRYAATLLYRHRDRQWLLARRCGDEGDRAAARLEQCAARRSFTVRVRHDDGVPEGWFSASEPHAALSEEEHAARVREILRWIERGHIYQANLTYPMEAAFAGNPEALFLSLRTHNPAPFGAFLAPVEGVTIVSSSPELFLRLRGNRIQTRPIKGTAPRHLTDRSQDRLLARQLFHSEKDRAELTMIVDLERNDFGRICTPGTVRALPFPRVESYERVHHLAATVQGSLASPLSMEELFASTFPGGSVTGAPKIRAMEILRDLEVAPRWIYTGTLGTIDDRGHVDLALMIRTLWIDRDRVTFHVGGGIVADSVPESEWHETQHKAAAMLAALRAGADGTARFDDARSIRRRRDHHVVGDWGTIP
jgi:anthranilate/para-aminobenzoate synthase component I